MSRDDFRQATKRRLAERVGFMCCYPGCRTPHTIGAARGHEGVINLGIAAHITAASPEGPRYDAHLTEEQRKSLDNGIWMCNIHGKAIDSDEETFEVEILRKWKRNAEEQSLPQVWTRQLSSAPDFFFEEQTAELALIQSLGLAPVSALQDLVGAIRSAADRDIQTFRHAGGITTPIARTLRVDDPKAPTIDVPKVAAALEAWDSIKVVAGPGVGKSTTLIQCCEAILATGSLIPIFIDLPSWSVRGETFLQAVAGRLAFSAFAEAHLKLLAAYGRLVLVLDGWNQLDNRSRQRVAAELQDLKRQYIVPLLMSTRRQSTDIPIEGPVVTVQPLSEQQQDEIALGAYGKDGLALLSNARRTTGMSELLATPLYLHALLRSADETYIPTTKEELLRLFVKQHEQSFLSQGALHKAFEFPDKILDALAVAATRNANTTIVDTAARQITSQTQRALQDLGLVTEMARPGDVLSSLVSHHLLVSDGSGNFAFQHQQFQEWFASRHVELVMRAAAAGDLDASSELRRVILNLPIWEEALLFAAIRMSREGGDGDKVVANAVRQALSIDPLLGAELIYRSGDGVWNEVGGDVIRLASAWHVPGTVDRGFAFMASTTRDAFAEPVWTVLSHADEQICFEAVRTPKRFRPSSLGARALERLENLAEPCQFAILTELAYSGGADGAEFAKLAAKGNASHRIQEAVLEGLLYRGREDAAVEILDAAPNAVWRAIARPYNISQFTTSHVSECLAKLYQADLDAAVIENKELVVLLAEPFSADVGDRVREFLLSDKFEVKEKGRAQVSEAFDRYPSETLAALSARLIEGRALPWRTEAYLVEAGIRIDSDRMAATLSQDNLPDDVWRAAAPLLSASVILPLLHKYVERAKNAPLDPEGRRAPDIILRRWEGVLQLAPEDGFVDAIVTALETLPPVDTLYLAEIMARHGEAQSPKPFRLDAGQARPFIQTIRAWADLGQAAKAPDRRKMERIVEVISRVADPSLFPMVKDMLEINLNIWGDSREKMKRGDRSHDTRREAQNPRTWSYRNALLAIATDEVVQFLLSRLNTVDFGLEAAAALVEIWANQEDRPFIPVGSFSRFSEISVARAKRRQSPPTSHPFAEAIFSAVSEIIENNLDTLGAMRVLQMTRYAFQLPHTVDWTLIDRLIGLHGASYEQLHLCEGLAIAGHLVPSRYVTERLDALFDASETEHWLLEESRGELGGWVAMAAFTEAPDISVEAAISKIGRDHLREHHWRRRLSEALSALPAEDSEPVLVRLATEDMATARDQGWLIALLDRGSLAGYQLLLKAILNGELPDSAGGLDRYRNARHLASGMGKYESLRTQVYQALAKTTDEGIISTLVEAVAKSKDAQGLLALIDLYQASNLPFDWRLSQAVESVVLGQRLEEGTSNVYHIHSVPAAELRQTLFLMARSGDGASALAGAVLTRIDELRDQHGFPETEPRHPDIASGVPWPMVTLIQVAL